MSQKSPHRSLLRRFRWPLIILAVLTLLPWGVYEWLVHSARGRLDQRLADRGLVLTCRSESLSPWGGITLKDAALRRRADANEPVAFISAVHIDVQWWDSWHARAPVTHWQADDATLVVNDEEGEVTLEHFSTDFIVREGLVEMKRLGLRHDAALYDVSGQIITASKPPAGPKTEFQLRLKALRGILNTLKFTGSGEFKITGRFELDVRERPWKWTADLHGEGREIAWRAVPMQHAVSDAQLSHEGMQATNQVTFGQEGTGKVEIKREGGWKGTPLQLEGTLTDGAGRSDEFTGSYQTAERTLTIDRLSGRANLLALARNLPALAGKLPQNIQVKTFPDIAARDFVCTWHTPGEPPTWSLESMQLRSPADIAISVQKHPLNIDDITGTASYAKGSWQFTQMKGKLLGGSFGLNGSYDGRVLSKADVALRSLNISRLSPWAGKVNGKLDNSELTLAYKGAICGREPVRSTGSGSIVLTNAPVVHIPILDQAYSLFPKLLPRKGSDGTGEFQVSFVMTKGVAAIDPFKARSESVTVTAKGTVDLVRKRVDGHARANLRGIVGIATSPLSHVLTDMDISGPLSDVRISPQGPVAAAKGAVKAATGGAKFSSKVIGTGLTLPFRALGMLGDD
ncbi:MAG: AsmA-like C-terminal region-containing protein [Prosthecobacter sp.]